MSLGSLKKVLLPVWARAKVNGALAAGGKDRRQQIRDLVSNHLRLPEIEEDRLMSGHWKEISSLALTTALPLVLWWNALSI